MRCTLSVFNTRRSYYTGEIQLVQLLQQLRRRAREVNAEVAGQLGIEQSAAITCIKPSGVGGSSGDMGG